MPKIGVNPDQKKPEACSPSAKAQSRVHLTPNKPKLSRKPEASRKRQSKGNCRFDAADRGQGL
jgi:hypothetical protein